MSGKFAKKNANKKKNGISLLLISVCAIVLTVLVLVFWQTSGEEDAPSVLDAILKEEEQQTEPGAIASGNADSDDMQPLQNIHDLGSGLEITGFLSYTGAFVEDRTDEVVTDVLAIQVANNGEEYIQTMDIALFSGETQAQFSLSTLFPGETVVVLEKNRMAYSTAPEFDRVQADAVAMFDEHPGMCEDKLEIQCLDGVINVTNISEEDITGDILIYYKNYVSGMYYGGITYRLRIEGGMKAGEIRQGSAAHFNPDNSTVVFVTCG